jgi:hypothetical protein
MEAKNIAGNHYRAITDEDIANREELMHSVVRSV